MENHWKYCKKLLRRVIMVGGRVWGWDTLWQVMSYRGAVEWWGKGGSHGWLLDWEEDYGEDPNAANTLSNSYVLWAVGNPFRCVSRKLLTLVSMDVRLAGTTATVSTELAAHLSPLRFGSFYANYALGGNSPFTYCNMREWTTQGSLCLEKLLLWQPFNGLSNLKDATVIMTNSLRCFRETRLSLTYFWKGRRGKSRSGNHSRRNNFKSLNRQRLQKLLSWPWERPGHEKGFLKRVPPSLVSTCSSGVWPWFWLFALTSKMLFLVLS